MLKRHLCDARFELEIEVKGPVLIKSGEAGFATGPDMSFVRSNAYGGETPLPYLPGTSLKGVIRSQVERIARTLSAPETTAVCLPYSFDNGPEQSCGKRFDKKTPKPQVYRGECLACRMFGSLEFKGRVNIDDAYAVDPGKLRLEVRDGVAIDRKTGGAAAKYDLEVLTAGTFKTTILANNFELWQLGALGLVLADLWDERIRFGLGTSRGLGHVRGEIKKAEIRYSAKHDETLVGIERLVSAAEKDQYGLFSSGNPGMKLPQGIAQGIWKLHHIERTDLDSVFDAGRNEFVSFMDSYRWNGGRA